MKRPESDCSHLPIATAKQLATWFLGALLLSAPATIGSAQQDWYQIQLRGGTVLQCEIPDAPFTWNDVGTDGAVITSTRQLANIRSINFAEETVTEQVATVKDLCDQLADGDFHRRNEAEKSLLDQAGPFIEILEKRLSDTSGDSESRFRLARILERLDDREGKPQAAFDLLVESDSTLRGDAPDFSISARVFGQDMTFSRSQLVRIRKLEPQALASSKKPAGGYQAFDKPDGKFYLPEQTVVDFDNGKNGTVLQPSIPMEQLFTFQGVHLLCEGEGNQVFTADYSLESRSRRNSGVTFDKSYNRDGLTPRFKGVLRISFCNPDQPNTAATTTAIGLFLQVIRPARTIVVEAYNHDDECVAVCEAFSSTSFTGILSEQPISYVRILTNSTLVANGVELDNDYASDDLVFDPLQLDPLFPQSDRHVVSTRTGDLLSTAQLEFDGDQLSLSSVEGLERDVSIPLSSVATIAFPSASRVVRTTKSLAFARLADGSVIAIDQWDNGGAIDFGQLAWLDQATALWGKENACRFPVAEDFTQPNPVAVFPTYRQRIADLTATADKLSWTSATTHKQFDKSVDGISDPDWGSDFKLAEAPCVWFPETWNSSDEQPAAQLGMIRLTDGQRFALGGSGGFRLAELNGDDLTISNGNDKILLPMTQVKSIVFPPAK